MVKDTTAVVSFRNADLPRPLAARLIGAAHPDEERGHWLVTLYDGNVVAATSFEAAVRAVQSASGVRRLLIVWTDSSGPE